MHSHVMHHTLDDWFSHIQHIHQKRMDLGLDRVGMVAERLQLRQFSCPVITVAGTNGKGSCTKTLESIYAQAGFKTALYTSPHLMHFNERIRIANQTISDADLLRAFEKIESARVDTILSFFEFTTLAALWLFQQAACDVLILEVGLGGRLDAVNIVENDVAVITSIALDHMEWLGEDRESIAYEKASIARAGKPVISGEENPPEQIAQTVAAKKGILYQINHDFFYRVFEDHFYCAGKDFSYDCLPVPHLKPQNIATAICVIEVLKNRLTVSQSDVATGIIKTEWAGRFELCASPFPCILDVAHNPHAAAWLAEQYARLPRVQNTIAIVGMLKDKAMIETASQLIPYVNTWYVCSLLSEAVERGSNGLEIAHFLETQGIKNCYTFASVEDAMYSLVQAHCQQECDRALIFGSFYTVAAAKSWLANKENTGENQWKKKSNNV